MCAKKTPTTKPSTGNKLHQQQQLHHQQQQPTNSSSSSSSSNLNKNRDKKLIKLNSMVDNKNDLKQQQQQQLSSTGLLVVSKKKTNSMNNLTPVASTPATTIPLTSTTTTTTPNVLVSEKIGAVKSKASTGTTITATSSTSVSKTMKKSKSVGEIGIGDVGGGGSGVAVVVAVVGGKINDNNGKQEKTNDAKTNTIDHDKSSGNNKLNRMNDHKTNSKRDEIKSKANNKNKLVDNVEKLLSDKSNEKPVVVVSDVKTVTSSMAIDNDTTAKGAVDGNTTKSNASASKKLANKVKTKVDKRTDNQKKCVKPKAVKIIKKVAKGKDCKTTIKISNELKNLGVNMAKSASAISSCDETMPNEVKTSICEMVKTKTRICVTPQSTISSKSQSTHLQDMVKTKADVKLNKETQEKKIKSIDAKIKSKKAPSLEIATVANQQEKLNEQKSDDIAAKSKKESKPKESKLKKEKSNLEKATESTAGKNVQSSTSNILNLEENKKDFPSDASATPKKKYVKKQKDSIIDKQIDINNTPMAPASSAASTPVKRKYVKKKKPGEESEKTSAENRSVESCKKKKPVQSNTTDKVEPKNGQKKINTPKEPKESKGKKAKIVQKDESPPSAIKPQKEILKTGFEVEYSLEKPKSDELLKIEPSDKETKITVKDINSLLEPKAVKQTEIIIKEEHNASVVISMEKEKELTTNKTTALAAILPAIATKIKRKYIRKNLPTSSQPIIKKSSKKQQSELPVANVAPKPKPELKAGNEIKLENKIKPSGNVSDLKAPGNIIVNTEIESQKNLTKSDIKEKLMEIPAKVEQQQKKETEKCLSDSQSKKNFIGKLKSDEELTKDSITKAVHADETTITTSSKKQPPTPIKSNKKTKSDKDPLKVDTSDCVDSTDNSDSEDDYSGASFVKPRKPPVRGNLRARKVKQFGPKRTRVASLNAIAKVHCLYENEARSALETNIHNAEQMAIAAQKQKCGYGSTTDDEDDDANVNNDKDMQAVIPR